MRAVYGGGLPLIFFFLVFGLASPNCGGRKKLPLTKHLSAGNTLTNFGALSSEPSYTDYDRWHGNGTTGRARSE